MAASPLERGRVRRHISGSAGWRARNFPSTRATRRGVTGPVVLASLAVS